MDTNKLLSIPGVTAVFDGTKKRNGIDTGEWCTIVGVARKKPISEIPESEMIPSTIMNKVTDVVEFEQFKAYNQSKMRPIIGGLSIGLNDKMSSGTLGIIVRDNLTKNIVALTNTHVVGLQYDPAYLVPTGGSLDVRGNKMAQPSIPDGGTQNLDVFGSVVRSSSTRFGLDENVPANLIDAAIISIDDLNGGWFSVNQIHAGPFPFGNPILGMPVKKSGRTTGLTSGTISSVNFSLNVAFGEDGTLAKFTNQIFIDDGSFGAPGDSGSALLAIIGGKIHVVGLLFAGSSSGVAFNPIQRVSEDMNISAWDGSIVVPRDVSPEITVNSTLFNRLRDTTDPITHEVV